MGTSGFWDDKVKYSDEENGESVVRYLFHKEFTFVSYHLMIT